MRVCGGLPHRLANAGHRLQDDAPADVVGHVERRAAAKFGG
jgi:hypothetical protein